MTAREVAIARSVIYPSLFDYPLTLEELHHALIESDQTTAELLAVYDGSEGLQAVIDYRDGFFTAAGRDDLIGERRRREALSRAFLERHARLLRLVCALPFTRMVALSGSIAHLNLDGDGDLDLFIITRGRRVWTVTLAVIALAKCLGLRRTVCANFVVSDAHMAIEQQDLFAANQAIHLRPLMGEALLEAFFAANPFITRFYPNGVRARPRPSFTVRRTRGLDAMKTVLEWILGLPSPLVEAACRRLYGWHLRRRAGSWQSPDQVRLQSDYLKLHTRSHRHSVLDRFHAAVDRALDQADRPAPQRAAAGGRR